MREFISPRQWPVSSSKTSASASASVSAAAAPPPIPSPDKGDDLSAIMARRRQMADVVEVTPSEARSQPTISNSYHRRRRRDARTGAPTTLGDDEEDEQSGSYVVAVDTDGGSSVGTSVGTSVGGGGSGSEYRANHAAEQPSDLEMAMMKRRAQVENGSSSIVHQSPRQRRKEAFHGQQNNQNLDSSLRDKLQKRLALANNVDDHNHTNNTYNSSHSRTTSQSQRSIESKSSAADDEGGARNNNNTNNRWQPHKSGRSSQESSRHEGDNDADTMDDDNNTNAVSHTASDDDDHSESNVDTEKSGSESKDDEEEEGHDDDDDSNEHPFPEHDDDDSNSKHNSNNPFVESSEEDEEEEEHEHERVSTNDGENGEDDNDNGTYNKANDHGNIAIYPSQRSFLDWEPVETSDDDNDEESHYRSQQQSESTYTTDDTSDSRRYQPPPPRRQQQQQQSSESESCEYEEQTVESSTASIRHNNDSSTFIKQASFDTLGSMGTEHSGVSTTTDQEEDPFERPKSVSRDDSFLGPGRRSEHVNNDDMGRITEHDEEDVDQTEEEQTIQGSAYDEQTMYDEQTIYDDQTVQGQQTLDGERSMYGEETVTDDEGIRDTEHSPQRNLHQVTDYDTDSADGYEDQEQLMQAADEYYAEDNYTDDGYDENVETEGENDPLYEIDTIGGGSHNNSCDEWSVDEDDPCGLDGEASSFSDAEGRSRAYSNSYDDRSILSGLSVLEAVIEEGSVIDEDGCDLVFGGKVVDGKIDRDVPLGSADSIQNETNETIALTSDDWNNESREQPLPKEDKKERIRTWCTWSCMACSVLLLSIALGAGLGMLLWQEDKSDISTEPVEPEQSNIFTRPSDMATIVPATAPLTTGLPAEAAKTHALICLKLANCDSLLDMLTPQGMAFHWLVNNTNANPDLAALPDESKIRRYALATVFFSTGGTSWSNQTNWMSSEDECKWFSTSMTGSACGVLNTDFANLELDNNNVQGELPFEVALLTSLTSISIRNPPSSTPDITGTLPTHLGLLTSLTSLVLAGNLFSGGIPTDLAACTSIKTLDLSYNGLNGVVPASLAALSNLVSVNLEGNFFSGELDPTIFEGTRALVEINLQGNKLTGIPTSILGLSQLRTLNVGSNAMATFPLSVTELTGLTHLDLGNNILSGQIPVQLGKMTSLRYLDLSGNSFSGAIPVEVGMLVQLVDALDLSNNRLTGPIPSTLGQLVDLVRFKLSGNMLTGLLPSELAALSKVEEFRIESNGISGSVPADVCFLLNTNGPISYADCGEYTLSPCFTYCCTNGNDCVCRFEQEDPFRCVK